jgi:phenylalanyl-tRNA synthetase beta chain
VPRHFSRASSSENIMRVPISWLKDFVDLNLSVPELAERLTLAGLEVEHIEYFGLPGAEVVWDADKIFVAQVERVERHPNADRLLLVTLDYGTAAAERKITVVTGAPNLKPGDAGQNVVLALKGSRLYDGHKPGKVLTTLKEATLRGIKNDAMVCSEKELGISEEHEGIILLPDDAPVGAPLMDYLGDAVLEIAILPNTIRCASILGIAREVAAITGTRVRYPDMSFETSGAPIESEAAVRIEDPRLNPRFTAGLARGVVQAPSPFFMQHRLKLVGQRPIGNIVDISNYVMFEFGQPTHTFDFAAIRPAADGRRTIVTRLPHAGESIVTLDGKPHELQPNDILVCDETGPLSVAGVMGGAESEVKEGTRDVLFETAAWHSISIRRTARFHNFSSEASYRFARGIHPALTMLAQKRGLHLLQRYAGAAVAPGIIDEYPQPTPVVQIELHPSHVTRLIGMDIPVADMTRILEALEFVVAPQPGSDALLVTAPDHRLDIEGEHDLIEEIARIHGLDKLPTTLMRDEMAPAPGNPSLDFEEQVRDLLADVGLTEIISYRMTTPAAEARLRVNAADERPYIGVVNPINPDRTVMRHSLLAGMLESLAGNVRHHARVALFEVGSVYLTSDAPAQVNKVGGIDELPRVAVAMTGRRDGAAWRGNDEAVVDFYDLKGVIESLLDGLRAPAATFRPTEHPSLRPGRAAEVVVGATPIGAFGELHPRVREALALDLPNTQPVLVAEFDLDALRSAAGAQDRQVRDVPRVPAVVEDLAVVVDDAVPATDVAAAIRRAGGAALTDVRLFDVYRGEQLGAGKKSLASTLTYQGTDKTISDADAEKLRNKIIRSVETQIGATVRKSA